MRALRGTSASKASATMSQRPTAALRGADQDAVNRGADAVAFIRCGGSLIEKVAEELIEATAPGIIEGPRSFFVEEDIKAAFPARKGVDPPNCDVGIVFPDGVVLAEVVMKPMNKATRSGDITSFRSDVEQVLLERNAGQLVGTAQLLRRSPQPPGSPLGKPAEKVFPVLVAGSHVPVNPVSWR